jgi:hypothetical protein
MRLRTFFIILSICFLPFLIQAAKADKSIYIPQQVKDGGDINDSTSQWCYQRSIQGKDIIIFWEKGYGTNDPNSSAVPSAYRVDVKDMLAKLEGFYDLNINTLKFATVGQNVSYLDKYKMVILLYYTTDWMAYGSGFDYTIGGMWVSPSTCHPVGSTIAHEIGHSFQYQVYCDYMLNHPSYNSDTKDVAFQYNIGSGNGYWETTAQWQAMQAYPDENFTSYNYTGVFRDSTFFHPYNEHQRYANYFINEWFTYKRGIETVSRLWHECIKPEDPSQTYMRLFYGDYKTMSNINAYSDELYDMAAHWVTWDIPTLRTLGANHIGDITTKLSKAGSDNNGKTIWQVDSANCPQEHGFNHIELNVPEGGGTITARFKGVAGSAGYNKTDYVNSGWKFGFVALLKDGQRVYSTVNTATFRAPSDTVTFDVPSNTSRLWMVVLAAPSRYYRQHLWDENMSNDEQWPYQVSFDNTNLLGFVDFTPDETMHNATIAYDVNIPVSSSDYEAFTFKPDYSPVCHAFLLQPDEITPNLGKYSSTKNIRFYNVNANSTLYSGYTTNTSATNWGGWFDGSGNVCSYGNTSIIYNDFNLTTMSFTMGRYPGKPSVGQKVTIRQAFVYQRKYQVTFQFNVTFVDATATAAITGTTVTTVPTSIIQTELDKTENNCVYDLEGHKVSENGTDALPKGIYITNGKKVIKR